MHLVASRRTRVFSRSGLHTVNLFLVLLVLLAFIFCVLLYVDMVSTRRSIELLARRHMLSSGMLADLNRHYRHERTMDLLLIGVSALMGASLLVIYRYLVRVATALLEVETIDRDILNSITRGIVTVNLQGKITSCNRALEQILAVEADRVFGRPLEELFPREDPLRRLLEEAIEQEARPLDLDLDYTTRDGRTLSLRLTTFALKNEVGKRVGGILLVKDMTELRKMEERIQRASRLAALGELTQRLVHEMRNPLSAMHINLQLLQERLERGEGDPEVSRYLNIISTETQRLDEVLRNAQLLVQPRVPCLETVDLHQVIRHVVLLLQAEAARLGVEFVDKLQAEASLVKADRDQLEQVFINLFKNSMEAMSGGGKLEINTRNAAEGRIIGVEVIDTGSGIPMGDLHRVFDPYFTTKRKGTGLGLSIVHGIISQHGGSVDVSSWLGEGTVFTITLPVVAAAETDNNGDPKAENSHSG